MSAFPTSRNLARLSAVAASTVVALTLSGCGGPKPKPAAPARSAAAAPKAAPAPAVTGSNSAEFVSVFEDLPPQVGKDPFFPNSHRRDPAAPVAVASATPVHVEPTLVLKGIVSSVGRRLAIINNETMETGEESAIRTPTGRVRVKCLEIGTDSALVQIEGEPQPKKLVMEQKR